VVDGSDLRGSWRGSRAPALAALDGNDRRAAVGSQREAEALSELENRSRFRALARVFGEDRTSTCGKLHLSASARATQNPDLRWSSARSSGFDLDLDEILDLRILGTVGTKLDVAVDFNSSRELE
jgi:hypothetical protein